MYTFPVHHVLKSNRPLPEVDSRTAIQEYVGGSSFEALSQNIPNMVALHRFEKQNTFMLAVHKAFDEHRPLAISPDHIWLCIMQGVSDHISQDPERLRHKFVEHSGKLNIEIRRDHFVKGSSDNDWEGCFEEFSAIIKTYIGKRHDLLVPQFSTTSPIEQAAFNISLMDAMKNYFKYGVRTLCGFPEITLEGTPDDWRSIKERVMALSEFDLKWWVDELHLILDHFIATSEGNPNKSFWERFYKESSESGGPFITGWINTLFPYLLTDEGNVQNSYMSSWKNEYGRSSYGGPRHENFKTGLSSTPFYWQYFSQRFDMEIVSGFVGIEQRADMYIRPVIGWGIREETKK